MGSFTDSRLFLVIHSHPNARSSSSTRLSLPVPPLGKGASQATSSEGLGFVDAKSGLLQIKIEVPKASIKAPTSSRKTHMSGNRRRSSSDAMVAKEPSNSKGKGKAKVNAIEMEEISIEIQQDLSGLRNRAGDTGSVVWRAS